MNADACLDAGLLIRADDEVLATQCFTIPNTRVEIQHSIRLLHKMRVTWEDPVSIPPGLDRVGIENSPYRARTDRATQRIGRLRRQIRQRQTAQRQLRLADRLTGDRFDDGLIPRGKKWPCGHALSDRSTRNLLVPIGVAKAEPSWDEALRLPLPRRSTSWHRNATATPSAHVETRRAGRCASEQCVGNAPRTRQGTLVGRTGQDRT